MKTRRSVFLLAISLLVAMTPVARAQRFLQTNLVTDDQSAHAAQVTDPNLINPWGMSSSPTSPIWVSNNGAGNSTLYTVAPANDLTTPNALVVTIPHAGSVTGQVFNGGVGFNSDRFIFVSEDGTISGWRGALGTTAEVLQVPSSDTVYKGAAIADVGGFTYLYSANFKSGTIDILKAEAISPNLAGNFTDPVLPAGYAPFNIQNLGGTLYVTYAKQDPSKVDHEVGAGFGFVDAFDLNGVFLRRVATNGSLNAPWGLALAPTSFGDLAGALLVANAGDGRIGAFNPSGGLIRQLDNANGDPLSIVGLWGLQVGNGGNGGSPDRVYFTAGPDGGVHGLFGSIAAVPEPTSLIALGLGAGALFRRRKLWPS